MNILVTRLKSFKKSILFLTVLFLCQHALNTFACGGSGTVCPPASNTFTSTGGTLNIIMIAQAPSGFTLFSGYNGIIPWTWSMCYAADFNSASQNCNSPLSANDQYSGPLIQLQQGDTLNITLINKLPFAQNITNLENIPFLYLNPTNIHTHGLVVSPHYPYPGNNTYGDNIFVMLFNAANGNYVPGSGHDHGDVIYNTVNYSITIPQSHPSGLYWIHPHLHGLTSAQVTAGMRGIITIGQVSNYVSIPAEPAWPVDANTSYLALQDSQILPASLPIPAMMNTNPDPTFCSATPNATEGITPRQGFCPGTDSTAIGGANYSNGTWFHPVSGYIYPSITISEQQVLAIANVGDSRTYNLQLQNRNSSPQCNMLMQILSIDGNAIDTSNEQALLLATGGRFVPETCPDSSLPGASASVCTSSILMMPSSRVEVLAAYRDCSNNNKLTTVPVTGADAVLTTTSYNTGPAGDYWPTVDLASVHFVGGTTGNLAVVSVPAYNPALLASQIQPSNALTQTQPCQPLGQGYKRRIFYGNPQSDPDEFGLAYEIIDSNGNVVGKPATDLIPFSMETNSVCVPLGANNEPATEVWELVNVATENHNFHIHQQKFQVISQADILRDQVVPSSSAYLMDNIPIPHALGNCGQTDGSNPITDWRTGLCKSRPVTIQLNFSVTGDYVYHCHILQHEDGGMMAKIRVVPFPPTS